MSTTLTDLGKKFLENLNRGSVAVNSSEMIDTAIVETVEPLIRHALDWAEDTPLATNQHVDNLMAAILTELGKQEAPHA